MVDVVKELMLYTRTYAHGSSRSTPVAIAYSTTIVIAYSTPIVVVVLCA